MEKVLVLGTTNPAKLRDFQAAFSKLGIVLRPSAIDVEEIGSTFKDNAILKARACSVNAGLPCVADDGGLEIDALDGEPGVVSRRWPGYKADDEELITYALERMKDVPEGKRSARFRTVVAFATPEGKTVTEERSLEGELTSEPSPERQLGYPYRSIFWLPGLKKYAVHFTPGEEEKLSHRRHALEALLPVIRNYFEEVQ